MLDRRRILMAGSALLATAPRSRPVAAGEPDIVVIGAGAAGLSAARALLAAGRSVVVLEARDRLGGRAFTDPALGIPYDAGAMYIHWAERNPWTQIARDLGIATTDEPRGGGFRVFAGGAPMPEADLVRRRGLFGQIDRRIEAMPLESGDLSVARLLGDLGPELAPVATSGLLLSLGEEADRISARDYRQLWSGDDLVVPEGYGTLVARYGAGVPVRLATAVTALDWSGDGVRIETASGTLSARACIVTVPVGVLQAGSIRFRPALPARTRDALAGFGMGALTKIALRLDGRRFGVPPGTILLEAGDPHRLISLELFPGDRDIVIGYCGGDYARELAHAGTDAAVAHVTDLLARMLGDDLRRAVRQTTFPAWWTDPFARGSYSICRPGHETARDRLAEPVGERIWFAGEATAGGGAMTVGGATLAGRAAAAAAARLKA